MKNQFVTYDQSLALKQLGFDEPCFGYYDNMRSFAKNYISSFIQQQGEPFTVKRNSEIEQLKGYTICTAPLKQQVLDWFRDKHKMQAEILWRGDMGSFCYKTGKFKYGEHKFSEKDYESHEKAESACIDKLIELIKNN